MQIFDGRYTANAGDGCAMIIVGMRINRPWKVHRWLRFTLQAQIMTRWLRKHPQEGLLAARWGWIGLCPVGVQYWRSFEDMERFAKNPDAPHLPAWRRYNKRMGTSRALGLWHEVYRAHPGSYEATYLNMPCWGLAAATQHEPINGRTDTARQRLDRTPS